MELERLRNLGAVSSRRLVAAGINSVEELESMGALEAYRRVKEAFGDEVSLNMLYALEGAILDVPWHSLPQALAARLRAAAEGI